MSGLDPAGVARFAAMLRRHIGPGDPGAVGLLARGDDTHVEVVGARDVATEAPMARDTLFRIASMVKPVTAFAAMALVERGVLSLDAPVDPWLPELADRRVLRAGVASALDDTVPAMRAITLRDLLSSQCGLGAIMAMSGTYPIQRALDEANVAPGLAPRLGFGHDEYLARLGALPLAHQPGAGWLYHIGLEIAGVLLARAAGRPLSDVFTEQVLEPLAMGDSGFWVPPAKVGRLATQYRPTAGGAFEVIPGMGPDDFGRPPLFESGGGQGGALVSTADDFAAFARRLLAGGSAVRAMTTDQVSAATKAAYPFFPGFWETTGWGLGVGIHAATGRFGWDGGSGTTFFVDPGSGLIAILLTQRAVTSPTPVALRVDFEKAALGAVAA